VKNDEAVLVPSEAVTAFGPSAPVAATEVVKEPVPSATAEGAGEPA